MKARPAHFTSGRFWPTTCQMFAATPHSGDAGASEATSGTGRFQGSGRSSVTACVLLMPGAGACAGLCSPGSGVVRSGPCLRPLRRRRNSSAAPASASPPGRARERYGLVRPRLVDLWAVATSGGLTVCPAHGTHGWVRIRVRRGSMTIPQWALLGFAVWTLLVLFGTVGVYRWSRILTGRVRISDWQANQPQGSDWYRRAMRAHMNCV